MTMPDLEPEADPLAGQPDVTPTDAEPAEETTPEDGGDTGPARKVAWPEKRRAE